MTYNELWNELVEDYNRNNGKPEEVIQNSWRLFCRFCFNYSHEEIFEQFPIKMGTATKKSDIVIKEIGEILFVIEIKKYELSKENNQAQLFSYLNQLKVDIGILVCDNIYIFDYDYTAQGDKNNVAEIPFEKDNQEGIRFVELFSKENFDKENIREFIKDVQKKNMEEAKKETNYVCMQKTLSGKTSEKQKNYWNEFDKYLKNKGISYINFKPSERDWVTLKGIGLSGGGCISFTFKKKKGMGCEFYWQGKDKDKKLFAFLEAHKDEIEKKIGLGELHWDSLKGTEAARIETKDEDADLDGLSHYHEYFEWMITVGKKFIDVFKEYTNKF